MYTVDIDTGGTMTDGLVADGSQLHAIKVDTTPHDYTVSFRQVLVEAARALGHGEDLSGFLDQVSFIRWSSTITSNALGEGKGANVGGQGGQIPTTNFWPSWPSWRKCWVFPSLPRKRRAANAAIQYKTACGAATFSLPYGALLQQLKGGDPVSIPKPRSSAAVTRIPTQLEVLA